MAFQKVGLTFYCDIGRSRQSSSYPLTTFLVRHERRGACKKRFDFYKFAFFFSLFFRSVCLFVCVPERVKLKEAQKRQNKTKQTNDDGDNNWAGGRPGVLSAYTYLTLLTMKKKMAIKDFLILFCTIIFLVTVGVNVWRRRKIIVLI